MKNFLALTLIFSGMLVMLFGGIIWFLIELYEFVQIIDNNAVTATSVFWLILSWCLRSVIAFFVGIVLMILGIFLND